MGAAESSGADDLRFEGSFFNGENALCNRLRTLEASLAGVETAYREAQQQQQPAIPGDRELHLHGAVLTCNPDVSVLTGPVVGQVTLSGVVCLLEVDVAPRTGSAARITGHLCEVPRGSPHGRLVASVTLQVTTGRPTAFRFGGGRSDQETLRPSGHYKVIFSGLRASDARACVASFHTPALADLQRLRCVALSNDDPQALAPGEPTLWAHLADRLRHDATSVDVVLHLGGQVPIAPTFESCLLMLWEAHRRRVTTGADGWDAAVAEAAERLRGAYRRAWALPHKRHVLANASNLMLAGEGDVHAELWGGGGVPACLAHAQGDEEGRQEVLNALVRAARRVFREYQGQLLWTPGAPAPATAVATAGASDCASGSADLNDDAAVEAALKGEADARRVLLTAQLRLKAAETAVTRIRASGEDLGAAGAQALEGHVSRVRGDCAAARAALEAARDAARAPPGRAQGGLTRPHPAVALVLLDTVWSRVRWDGAVCTGSGSGGGDGDAYADALPCIAPDAWLQLERELSADSDLRLVIVACQAPLAGGLDSGSDGGSAVADPWSTPTALPQGEEGGGAVEVEERTRLFDLLSRWKAAERWREVVLLCGGSTSGIGAGCEVALTRQSPPAGVTLRQLVTGPVTGAPRWSWSQEGTVDGLLYFALQQKDKGDGGAASQGSGLGVGGALMQRSYLDVVFDIGASPLALVRTHGIAAAEAHPQGLAPHALARFVRTFTCEPQVLLGPVVGRVTQSTAVVLLEVDRAAAVACVLTNAVTGARHALAAALPPRAPHAFYFQDLAHGTPYALALSGVAHAAARTGALTTLPLWLGLGVPRVLRAAAAAAAPDAHAADTDAATEPADAATAAAAVAAAEDATMDLRALFVSGIGAAGGDGDNFETLALALGRPWPQADLVVHLGGAVCLCAARAEALSLLAAAEAEPGGSGARRELEGRALECLRDAYRHQWSLPLARAFLSRGGHLMVRGVADALGGSSSSGGGSAEEAGVGMSAYVRGALQRLIERAFDEYQGQLWAPSTVPAGGDMDDVAYRCGATPPDTPADACDSGGASCCGGGRWHFHIFAEAVGLFVLDLGGGVAALQRSSAAPMLCARQWSALAAALRLPQLRVLCVAGAAAFVTDAPGVAARAARDPSSARGARWRWAFRGDELLRLLRALLAWRAAGDGGGGARAVVLVGGGEAAPLKTVVRDADTGAELAQAVVGPFRGAVEPWRALPQGDVDVSRSITFRHAPCAAADAAAAAPSGLHAAPGFLLVRCAVEGAAAGAQAQLFTAAAWRAWQQKSAAPQDAGGTPAAAHAPLALRPRRARPAWAAAVAAAARAHAGMAALRTAVARALSSAGAAALHDVLDLVPCFVTVSDAMLLEALHRRLVDAHAHVDCAALRSAAPLPPSLVALEAAVAATVEGAVGSTGVAITDRDAMLELCADAIGMAQLLAEWHPPP